MQTTLLGLAIAIILALVAALVAPLVVDWNLYRSLFRGRSQPADRADRACQWRDRRAHLADVRVINLRDVEVGEPGRRRAFARGFLELEIGLGPLLRGEIRRRMHASSRRSQSRARQFGRVDWPALSPSFRPDALTISRFNVDDGRITLSDAISGCAPRAAKALVRRRHSLLPPDRSTAKALCRRRRAVPIPDLGQPCRRRRRTEVKLGVDPSESPLTTESRARSTSLAASRNFDGTLALDAAGRRDARGGRAGDERSRGSLPASFTPRPPRHRCTISPSNMGRKNGR